MIRYARLSVGMGTAPVPAAPRSRIEHLHRAAPRWIAFPRVIGSVQRSNDHHAAMSDGLASAGDVPGNRSLCSKVDLAQCRMCACTESMPTYRFAMEQTPLAIASRVGGPRGGPGFGGTGGQIAQCSPTATMAPVSHHGSSRLIRADHGPRHLWFDMQPGGRAASEFCHDPAPAATVDPETGSTHIAGPERTVMREVMRIDTLEWKCSLVRTRRDTPGSGDVEDVSPCDTAHPSRARNRGVLKIMW